MADSGTYTRIMIGAGCFADAQAAMRLADQILATLPAELGGILIEEDVMADIVQLPGQRVVTSGGSLMVPPSARQIQILADSDARAFRDKLSKIARARSAKWYFERRVGELIHGLFEASKGWDILLLGYREMHKRPGQVVVVTTASRGSARAEKLAGELAQVLETELLVLATEESEATPSEPSRVTMDNEPKLLAQLSRINASAVVVDLAACPLQTENQIRQLLEAARCPVVVLGAEQGQRWIEHSTIIPPVANDQNTKEGLE
ncbi:hypothetical protein [Falsiphaeobacter marinintestinus]|uniref:hypothetical protein n=1 Tax=Falsiphaeobacter marinintestinus TaxID=1492905 RepID=UPI0011B45068|nr:hypothetical protein [Phaeobacter marinintestinus]